MFRSLLLAALIQSMSLTAAHAAGFFIAIGGIDGKAADGHKLEGEFGAIYMSVDGKDWTQVFKGGPVKDGFNHANNNLLRCLTYGNGRFVATGNPKAVMVSDNGKDWRSIEAPSGAMSVEFGNGIFLAPNASHFMTSSDGLAWKSEKQPADFKIWGPDGAGHVRKTVFGNGVFVCVGDQRVGVTRDGKSWLHHEILKPDQRPGKQILLFGNGRFVWLTEKTGPKQSVDGIKWQPITTFGDLSENATFGTSGVFDGKLFLTSPSTYKNKNKIIYSSTDGVAWTKAVENAKATSFSTAGNGVLLQNNGWSKSFTLSEDRGKTWHHVKTNIPSRKVYFFDGKQIIGQSGG